MHIITISREFGSGGREFGKNLAESLGYAYYDRDIIEELSKKLALDENYLEHTLETNWSQYSSSYGRTLSANRLSVQNSLLLAEQDKLIKQLASRGNCVVVGANADIILKAHHPLRIFIYADIDAKIARCRERQRPEEANYSDRVWVQKIKMIDKGRSAKHELVAADYAWGDKRGYDLCVNTSSVVIKNMIPALKELITAWFKE